MSIQDRVQAFGCRMPPVSFKKQKLHEAEIDVLIGIEFDLFKYTSFFSVLEVFKHKGIMYSTDQNYLL